MGAPYPQFPGSSAEAEAAAVRSIELALQALRGAADAAANARYGLILQGELARAIESAQLALDLAEDR